MVLRTCVEIKFYGAFALNRCIDFTPSTRHLLDGVAMPVPRRSTEPGRPHPTHWLICTQVTTKAGAKVSVYADRCGLELPDGAMADGGMMCVDGVEIGASMAWTRDVRAGTRPSRS